MNFDKSHLTRWYNDKTHPYREGVYEVQNAHGVLLFAYWSTRFRKWFEPNQDMNKAVYSEYTTNKMYWWRGLNRPFSEIMGDD